MSDFKDAYDAGREAYWPRPDLPANLRDHAIVLQDGEGNERVEYLPIEGMTGRLTEKRGTVRFLDVESFARYVTTHTQDGTRVYVNGTTLTTVAVLDGHGIAPGWGRHRAELVTQTTRVWREWMEFAKAKHDQVPFAEFIESHVEEIASPDGATLLEMVTTLQVKTNVEFASGVKLANGQVQLTYNEVIEGTALKGATAFPDRLTLVLRPIEGMVGVESVLARLRYRVTQGQLKLGVELHRPLDVLEGAFADRVAELSGKLGADRIFYGDAPAEVVPVVRHQPR